MAEIQPTQLTDYFPIEKWLPIPGYEGYYSVSDFGRVKSHQRVVPHKTTGKKTIRERILSPGKSSSGYHMVTLWKHHKGEHRTVHSLITEVFLGPPAKGMEVCHNNGIHLDNRLVNLRYGTRSENALDRNVHGTNANKNKTHCIRGHRLADPNLREYGKKDGHRRCLACTRAYHYIRARKLPKSELQRISDEYLEKILSAAQTA